MFILKDKKGNLHIHLNVTDMVEFIDAEGNIRITLATDKAKELEDRLEERLKEP